MWVNAVEVKHLFWLEVFILFYFFLLLFFLCVMNLESSFLKIKGIHMVATI